MLSTAPSTSSLTARQYLQLYKKGALGFTASGPRRIQSGTTYEHLFPAPKKTDPVLNENGDVFITVDYCKDIVLKTLRDTQQLAPLLKRSTLNDTCKAVFDFFYKNYQYKIDLPTVEQLRRPARAWHDRKTGIDCDCFTISVSSVLKNLGIEHYLRIVKMYNRDYYQHIYVVVPVKPGLKPNKRENYLVIDPVLDTYNHEAPFTEKHDTIMEGMQIQYLNGTGLAFGLEYETLGDGINGDGLAADFLNRTKQHLINTRNAIQRNPNRVNRYYNTPALLGAYDKLIGAWDNDAERALALEQLSAVEETFLTPSVQGLGDIIHGHDDALFGLIDADLEGLEGLEGKKQQARKQVIKKVAATVKKPADKAKVPAPAAPKKQGTKGQFTKLKNANKKLQTVAKAKGAAAKNTLKKVGKQVVKNNPVSLAARGGFLVAMKTNFGRLASRAVWAIRPASEATAAKVSPAYVAKSTQLYNRLRSVFVNTLKGNESALKKAILTGRAAKVSNKMANKGKLKSVDVLMGINGLGVVTEASVTAALAFITPVITLANNLFARPGGKEMGEGGNDFTPPKDPNSTEVPDASVTKNDSTIEKALVREQSASPSTEDDLVVTATNEQKAQAPQAPQANQPQPENTTEDDDRAWIITKGKNYEMSKKYVESRPDFYVKQPDGTYRKREDLNETNTPAVQNQTTTPDAETKPESKSGSGGLILLGLALLGGAFAFAKKSNKPVNGEQNTSKTKVKNVTI